MQPKQLKQLCHDLTWFHSHEYFNGNCGFSDFSGIQEGTYNGWLLTVTLPRQSTTIWTRNGSGSFWMFLTMRNPSKNIPPNMMLLDHQGYLEDPKVNFKAPCEIIRGLHNNHLRMRDFHGISDAAQLRKAVFSLTKSQE